MNGGELRNCPACGIVNRLSWCGRSRHWLCLTTGCSYSAPPDEPSVDIEKLLGELRKAYARLEKERDELRAKVAALEEKIENYNDWALERDTLE